MCVHVIHRPAKNEQRKVGRACSNMSLPKPKQASPDTSENATSWHVYGIQQQRKKIMAVARVECECPVQKIRAIGIKAVHS